MVPSSRPTGNFRAFAPSQLRRFASTPRFKQMSAPMLPSNGGDVGMVEEEDEVQIVEGARQQVGPHGMRTPGENLRILLAQKKAGKSSWGRW